MIDGAAQNGRESDPAVDLALTTPTASRPPLIELRDLSVEYHTRRGTLSRTRVDITAVDHVSLTVERGRTLGLVGGTGSGKSTIAQVVMGMVQPTGGSVRIDGHELKALGRGERTALQRRIQVVMQDPYSSLDPRMTAGAIIAEPLTLGRPTHGATKARIDARVTELLGLVGMRPNRASRYPHQFSGGQRQRIAIARALAPDPELIVLDEPTSALDVSVRAQILTLLRRLQTDLGVTYLVISHDLVTVSYLSTEVAVMHLGRIVEVGPARSIYQTPRHPYTLELLASAPGASGAFLRQPRPMVDASSLPASACRFAYRCALRTRLGDPDLCLEADPTLQVVAPGHQAACHFPDEVATVAEDADVVADPEPASTPAPA